MMIRDTWCGVRSAVSLSVAAGILTATVSAVFLQDQRPPVFQGRTNLVYVDAYPRQADKIVEGLQAEDFHVFEDGKPQTVQTFEFIRFESSPVDAERRDPNSVADSERQAADPKNRIFVIYLDQYHTTRNGSRDSRQPLLDFLTRTIGASDLFGVMTPETSASRVTFGRRTDTLEAELASRGNWGLADEMSPKVPRTPLEERLVACGMQAYTGDFERTDALLARAREDLLYVSLEELMARLRDLRDERKNVLLLSGGWALGGPATIGLQTFDGGKPSPPTTGVGPGGRIVMGNPQSQNPDDAWCRGQIGHLANIDFVERFDHLVTLATNANVSFYPIDVGGLSVGNISLGQRASPRGGAVMASGSGTETLRTLANATDGIAMVNSNDIAQGFRRVTDRLSSYYLLGYYSTNSANDGKFRKIEVKVVGPGLSVAARRGYYAPSAAATAAAAVAAARVVAVPEDVVTEIGRLGRLESGQEIFAYGVARDDGIDIVADLATRELARGRWGNGADVEVTVTDAAGTSAVEHARIERGRRGVVVHVAKVAGQGGPWQARVRITGDGPATEDRIDVVASVRTLFGAPVVFRGTASARVALQPVGEFLFRRNERLHVEWPVLKPLDQRAARLLDRRGQPLGASLALTDQKGAGVGSSVAADLTLGGLADGDYAVELTATGAGASERSLVAFRLGR